VGKSALLEAALSNAEERGWGTQTVVGRHSEEHFAFAGLHQLLSSHLEVLDRLPDAQQSAIRVAFGQAETETLDFFLIALASLNLLSEVAAAGPLLIVIDDAQWLDVATCDVLGFVARRLDFEPIVMLFAMRDDFGAKMDCAGLPSLDLQPLDESSSALLLDASASDLSGATRRRVLAEALGNPLALLELPRALEPSSEPDPDGPLPLTHRLERAFAARIADLPRDSRTLLLVAAVDDDGDLDKIMSAASIIEGHPVGNVDVGAAVATQAIMVDDNGLRFRQSLVRSVVYQEAGPHDRRAAHRALAAVYSNEPDRALWHIAASLSAPDERVAAELELLAERAERRGLVAVAASALERAAHLTTDDSRRGQLFLRAAWISYELGQLDASTRLVAEAQRLELTDDDRIMLLYMLEMFGHGNTWPGESRIGALVDIAGRLQNSGRTGLALEALEMASERCWWGSPSQASRDLVVAAAEHLLLPDDTAKVLSILAQADPVKQGARVVDRISRMHPDMTDPVGMYLVGSAATSVWAYDLALGFLDAAVDGLRTQGRLSLLARARVAQAWTAVHLAREPLAITSAEEGKSLSLETGQIRYAVSAHLAMAAVAAERGDFGVAESMTREAEAQLLPMGATPMLALVQFVRGRGAVAHQHYEEGFEHLRRVLDPTEPAYHPFIGAWGLSDLVEAASRTDRVDQANVYLQQLQSLADETSGSLLRAMTGYALPMVADDSEAEALYRQALERDLAHWPCYRGRMLLWYGRWLRRQKRVAESRAPLRAALEGFDALAFPELSKSAREELRSTGETVRQRTPEGWTQLTPQELQIAQLAASGHTNREIGEKLYLSHRTVEYHLHRIFPKLGITRRSHLREAI